MERIPNHFHEGLLKLVPPFWGKPRIAAFLQSFLDRVTDLEDAAWDVLEARTIDNADATRLAVLGRVVGQPNFGWDTETYRAVIRGRIRTARSRALTDDIIEVVRLITQTTLPVRVEHFAPATVWTILTEPAPTTNELDALEYLLPKARGAGIRQHLLWAPSSSPGLWNEATWGSATAVPPIVFVAAGAVVGDTIAISVPWPAHQIGDLAILVVATANEALATPVGWTLVNSVGVGTVGTTGVGLNVYYRFAVSGAEANAAVADSGQHQLAAIVTYRNVAAVENNVGITNAVSSTAAAAATLVTLGTGRTVVACFASAANGTSFSGYSFGVERVDNGAVGSTIAVADFLAAAAGSTGAINATIAVASQSAAIALALVPRTLPSIPTYWSSEIL